jgi:membrane protein DedA with SNARE-associated domain
MAFSLTGVATDLVSNLGYGGLSMGLVVDSFGVPIPSEVLIPLAVVASRSGRFDLWLVVVIATLAQLAGGFISYAIGRRGGQATVQRFGRYVLVSQHDVERAQRAFSRSGPWIVGLGRCLPVVRGFIGYPAGIARMPVASFVLWTLAGGAAWTGILVGLGEVWRSNVSVINHAVDRISFVVLGLFAIAVGVHVWRAVRPRPRSSTEDEPSCYSCVEQGHEEAT